MRQSYELYALSRKVLAVAVINTDENGLFEWSAYIDSVLGKNHSQEAEEVAKTGTKIKRSLAIRMFPYHSPEKYRI